MSLSNESSRILPALDDIFQGKCVLHDQLPECEETFKLMLEESLLHWTQNKVRGVWLTIPSEKASFIPIAIENKFVFHHAKPHYVTLTRWLPQDEQNKLPNYAFTHVGVGGFVLNEKNELLVVREKYAHQTASWKIPGGLVEAGESLIEAAIREVLEGMADEHTDMLHQHHWVSALRPGQIRGRRPLLRRPPQADLLVHHHGLQRARRCRVDAPE
ncbi:uncharacterized protein LOC126319956 isoform X2 [Schistocerca gregaria]|uniref:uncharacterized protein LOC126319956 isoform X2 n=1 Tax=Schistocerca gregaria TaxID=7010 RepID=UPI00211DA733|nr:uncharacterized protein LOC126319956 isoform X2 [Schistocerca gregaria]